MMLDWIMGSLRSFWTVWVFVFFSGIVLWAYWPKNKARVESYADIPLRKDEDRPE